MILIPVDSSCSNKNDSSVSGDLPKLKLQSSCNLPIWYVSGPPLGTCDTRLKPCPHQSMNWHTSKSRNYSCKSSKIFITWKTKNSQHWKPLPRHHQDANLYQTLISALQATLRNPNSWNLKTYRGTRRPTRTKGTDVATLTAVSSTVWSPVVKAEKWSKSYNTWTNDSQGTRVFLTLLEVK